MFSSMRSEKVGRASMPLLAGDWLALGLFVFLGQIDHEVLQLSRLLGQTVLLAGVWSVAALLLGALRVGDEGRLSAFLGRSLLPWLVAAPLGLLLRALIQGQATIIVAFMLVTMGLGGLFLLAWRALFFLAYGRRKKARALR